MFDVFVNFYFMNLCLLIFVVLNTASAVVIWLDKRNAQNGKKRISEHTLLVWALVGGWLGGVCAMYALRHKTSKRLFLVKYWLMAAIYISALFLLGYAMIQQMSLLQ
ncbi:MAG: DUF1294 domain-containing protein [SAR202 cluster bacterium]|mgnify:FL=1|nr:MAG: DUF1294 domain-containing protein [SAR202 cluster bacterium]MAT09363.1 hypothetical protein [Chloroflexota bacterium]KAA1298960.1 MAG: DUF1294 domain-containing protein [SAR202 cluster bacterium]KAA1306989.1 MAG: DUF1294 domain-containing protein [SAR202 cluster bacterium]MBF06966.1 hypothetical protein [Chloroflexota bacterium]